MKSRTKGKGKQRRGSHKGAVLPLYHPSGVLTGVCTAMANVANGNQDNQIALARYGLPPLIALSHVSNNVKVLSSVMSALLAIVEGNPETQDVFLDTGGMNALLEALSRTSEEMVVIGVCDVLSELCHCHVNVFSEAQRVHYDLLGVLRHALLAGGKCREVAQKLIQQVEDATFRQQNMLPTVIGTS